MSRYSSLCHDFANLTFAVRVRLLFACNPRLLTLAETSEMTSIDCIQLQTQSAVFICSWTAIPPSDVYTVTLSDSEGRELRRREVNREFTDFSGPDLKLEARYFVTVGQVADSIFVTGSHLLY